MTKEEFLRLNNGDKVIVIKDITFTGHSLSKRIKIKTGEELTFGYTVRKHCTIKSYIGVQAVGQKGKGYFETSYIFFRQVGDDILMSQLLLKAHSHLISKKVLERDKKIKQILGI